MKKYGILFLLFLSSSCLKLANRTDLFYQTMYPLVISTTQVEKSSLYVNTHQPLERPSAATIRIMKLITMDENFERSVYCLFYKIPNKSKKLLGSLKLIRSRDDCNTVIRYKPVVELLAIQELMIHLHDEDTIVERKRFSKRILYLEIKKDGQQRTLSFPLYNYLGEVKKKYERYSSAFQNSLFEGVTITAPHSSKKQTSRKKKVLGAYEDNYRDNNLTICHSYGKDCSESISYQCDQCRFGWFHAIPNVECGKATIKFCGKNQCGGKGMPACVRGYESALKMGLESKNGCYDNSPAGYCNVGLRTSCDGNTLICL